ncbi:exodeoxyribonuclease VII small subunit [Bacillus horti]|uniref:Exodeoxyribonuclease 7 small subunit n=1 Tax=Caldalkalibacillus horti TaxID=77523 RepID=A0ABT9W0W7_9BACI|nr:exodeoxyribonuclease VII small subunit [Bacillus horti]MDQ0166872.1 exodeoxyribonuclease VII small subunit [Bacillus horti]
MSKEQQEHGNKSSTLSFEEAMDKLETIVDQLEAGEVPLEQAIELFQEGMKLSQACHQKLEQVEKKVQILVEENDGFVKKDFDIEEEST